jgi:hypothetical protein
MNYVSLVSNQNTNALQRTNELNIHATPDVIFDGGYKVVIGGGTSTKNACLNAINQCNARVVLDVDADVSVQWLGNATMKITTTVTNNQAVGYRGKLKTYVCEYEATLNWKDSSGHLYTHAFLAYAFKEELVLAAGETWQESMIWDGSQYNDGKGHTFDFITYDNIIVIAAVSDSTWHQGYSYPPSTYPFDAYYLDAAASAVPDNFSADTYTIPEAGGTVNLGLYSGQYGGPTNRNRNYLIVGGVSGTTPGFPLPGGQVVLPINWDVFSDIVMGLANSPVFPNFIGKTGVDGSATAQINAPALPPGSAGLVMYFAYCMNNPFNYVSIPIEIEVVP